MGFGNWGIGNGKFEMRNGKGEDCKWELGVAKKERSTKDGDGRREED